MHYISNGAKNVPNLVPTALFDQRRQQGPMLLMTYFILGKVKVRRPR